jgi:hypothetical protein
VVLGVVLGVTVTTGFFGVVAAGVVATGTGGVVVVVTGGAVVGHAMGLRIRKGTLQRVCHTARP